MKINKLAIIGIGGIGSYFVSSLSDLIKKDISGLEKLNIMGINLFDFDLVEERNLSFQNFDIENLGRNKAEVLFEITGYKAITEKIEKMEQVTNYDFIVICADNNQVRNLIYETGKPFLDLRANEKTIMAYLTQKNDPKYLDLTKDDGSKGSCQREEDLEEKNIQCGNRVVAEIGCQILLDYLRNEIKQKELIMRI